MKMNMIDAKSILKHMHILQSFCIAVFLSFFKPEQNPPKVFLSNFSGVMSKTLMNRLFFFFVYFTGIIDYSVKENLRNTIRALYYKIGDSYLLFFFFVTSLKRQSVFFHLKGFDILCRSYHHMLLAIPFYHFGRR